MAGTTNFESAIQNVTAGSPLRAWLRHNRSAIAASVIGLLGLVLWSLWSSSGKPQRLRDLPYGWRPIGFRHGLLVTESFNGRYLAVPIDGGKPRVVLDLTQAQGGAGNPSGPRLIANSVQLTDSGLVYLMDDDPQPLRGGGGKPGIMGGWRTEYRQLNLNDMHGAKAVRSSGNYSLHVARIASGTGPVELAKRLNSPRVFVSGRKVCWVDWWRWENVSARLQPKVTGKVRVVPLFPSINKLVRVSIDAELPTATESLEVQPGDLMAGKAGLFWTAREPVSDGPARVSLCYLRNDERTPHTLADYKGTGQPIEMGNRLYWLEASPVDVPSSITPETPVPYRLVSSSRDLENVVVEGTFHARQFAIPPLFATDRSLYLWCEKAETESQPAVHWPLPVGRVDRRQMNVYAIQLKPHFGLRLVTTFPAGTECYLLDGRELYSIVNEERENWFDWSADGLRPKQARVLYRFRLPE